MKTYKKIVLAAALIIAFSVGTQQATAQNGSRKEEAVKNAVDSQQYIFYAEYVNPNGGNRRYLTAGYDLSIFKDSIISYLPYFGRAYTAPIGTGDGGIKFTSTSFEYTATPRKKGGWDISIKPKDVLDIQQLTMTIFDNGTASLQVISNTREAISFDGYVMRRKRK